jgi:hypothetical protein
MASRVTRGMAVVAALSALVLAGAAAGTAWLLWEADQRQHLRDEAESLVAAVEREARDEKMTYAEAAPEALRESTVPGVRVEVWTPAGLVASTGSGPEIGREGSAASDAAADWVVHRRRMPDGLVLVIAAPATYGRRALRVFTFSPPRRVPRLRRRRVRGRPRRGPPGHAPRSSTCRRASAESAVSSRCRRRRNPTPPRR